MDLIVLDVMMPGEDGLSVCRHLRATTDTPIIFLTAMSEDTDRIIGLELGADDYLVKPFNPRELLARIRAVLRRANGVPQQQRETLKKARVVRVGQWRINMGRQELSGDDGVGIPLSTAEFRLLKVFLERPGMVLSREQLLDLTVGRTADIFDRSIDNREPPAQEDRAGSEESFGHQDALGRRLQPLGGCGVRMIYWWRRSLAAQFIGFTLLALVVSQCLTFSISWDERTKALHAAMKANSSAAAPPLRA